MNGKNEDVLLSKTSFKPLQRYQPSSPGTPVIHRRYATNASFQASILQDSEPFMPYACFRENGKICGALDALLRISRLTGRCCLSVVLFGYMFLPDASSRSSCVFPTILVIDNGLLSLSFGADKV